jgi:hypothetical protein
MAITDKNALAGRGWKVVLADAPGVIGQRQQIPRLIQAGHDHTEPAADSGSTSAPAPGSDREVPANPRR